MKIRHVKVKIQNTEEFWKEVDKDLKKITKGRRKTFSEDSISFQSIGQLKAFLTPKRMELLKIIKQKNPKSIYELAKLVKRTPENVNSDIKLLKNMGFVSTTKTKDVRKKVKPEVNFDKLMIEISI